MRLFRLAFAFVAVLPLSIGAHAQKPVQPRIAPDFTRNTLDGKAVHLNAYRGKLVLLNFWATWCGPCLTEIPRFNTWQTKYGPQGLQVLGVSMDDDAAPVQKASRKLQFTYPVVMGDEKLDTIVRRSRRPAYLLPHCTRRQGHRALPGRDQPQRPRDPHHHSAHGSSREALVVQNLHLPCAPPSSKRRWQTRQQQLTLIGGPTLLIEYAGLRILTDPAFDPPQTYQAGPITLTKKTGPALSVEQVLPIDIVLISHEQHLDNLDISGRAMLSHAKHLFTTPAGAPRLGPNAKRHRHIG